MKKVLILFFTICVLFQTVAQQKNYMKILQSNAEPDIIRKAAEVVPSASQLHWRQLELFTFFHFGINTFTVKEWCNCTQEPKLFNPSYLDANCWDKSCEIG